MEENFSSLSLGKVGWLVELALGRACGSRDGDRRSDPRCALRGDIFEEAISAHVCVDAWILSSLFLSSSLSPSLSLFLPLPLFRVETITLQGVYGQPRTGVTRIRSRFTQVARVAKQRRGRERECGGERERERDGRRRVGELHPCV